MKLLSFAAAALVAFTGAAAATPAVAAPAPAPGQERVVVRERTVVRHEYRRHPRRVCTVRYRRGERIRTCRTVYRRY